MDNEKHYLIWCNIQWIFAHIYMFLVRCCFKLVSSGAILLLRCVWRHWSICIWLCLCIVFVFHAQRCPLLSGVGNCQCRGSIFFGDKAIPGILLHSRRFSRRPITRYSMPRLIHRGFWSNEMMILVKDGVVFVLQRGFIHTHTHKCSFIKFYFLLWEFLGFTPVTENLGHLCSVCRVRTSIPSLGEKKGLFFAFLKSAKDFPQYLVTSTVCSNWADLGNWSRTLEVFVFFGQEQYVLCIYDVHLQRNI